MSLLHPHQTQKQGRENSLEKEGKNGSHFNSECEHSPTLGESKGHIPLAAVAGASTEKSSYSGALLPFFIAV